jgi:hypothetical protein
VTPLLDPVQLGQTLGAVAVVGLSCVAAIRSGLARWNRGQDAARKLETRAIRSAVRAELGKALEPFNARLVHVERQLTAQASPVLVSARRRAATPPRRK